MMSWLFLLAADVAEPALAPRNINDVFWLLLPAIVGGVVVLFGFFAVHKRFLTSEFPGYVKTVDTQLVLLNKTLERIEIELRDVMLALTKNTSEISGQEKRLSRVESFLERRGAIGDGDRK